MNKVLVLILLGSFFFSACKKDCNTCNIIPPPLSEISPGKPDSIKTDTAKPIVTVIDGGISRIEWKYNNNDYGNDEIGIYTVVPDRNPDNGRIAGCTGISYNPDTKQFVVALYNEQYASKILLYDRNAIMPYTSSTELSPSPTKQIDITQYIDHLEGLDYDPELHAYWALGTKKGAISAGKARVLIRVNDSGVLEDSYELSAYDFQAGMLAVRNNEIFIKPNDRTWLLKIDKNTRQIIKTYVTYTRSEGLGINKENGDIWIADDDGAIKRFSSELVELGSYRSTVFNNDIEGLLIDPVDDTIWDSADTYFHGKNLNGNAMWHYDFLKTYKKFVRFPEMAGFSEGTMTDSLRIENNKLFGHGEWESPVMDFGDHRDFIANLPQISQSGKQITIQYHGSDMEPSTQAHDNMPCKYYDNWGGIIPDTYSNSPVNHRYQQIKLIIK